MAGRMKSRISAEFAEARPKGSALDGLSRRFESTSMSVCDGQARGLDASSTYLWPEHFLTLDRTARRRTTRTGTRPTTAPPTLSGSRGTRTSVMRTASDSRDTAKTLAERSSPTNKSARFAESIRADGANRRRPLDGTECPRHSSARSLEERSGFSSTQRMFRGRVLTRGHRRVARPTVARSSHGRTCGQCAVRTRRVFR